jgi:hypothetical protein
MSSEMNAYQNKTELMPLIYKTLNGAKEKFKINSANQ